jgi:hypothetical protein
LMFGPTIVCACATARDRVRGFVSKRNDR